MDQTKANLRPVSNLTYVSKLTESAAATQLEKYILENGLYPLHQFSYRKHHSTETALLKVRNDILLNMNSQQVTLFVLLDFSAAFDTVNHSMLLRVVRSKLGVGGTVLAWLGSYLSGRSQRIILDGTRSRTYQLNSGVPQGCCLGPLLFNIYVSGLFDIVSNHAPVGVHAYADDFQDYLSFSPSSCVNEEQAVQVIQDCVADIKSWARQHSLMLNNRKTELLVLGTRQKLSKTNISHLRVGDATVAASTSVRNLGSYLDKNFTMAMHVTKTFSAAFFHLHNIRQIRKFLSHEATETLIHAFVTSKVDYCNSLLYGLPAYQIAKLQRVQNAPAHLILEESRFCHITPSLRQLQWLPVHNRIIFKILLIAFKAIHGLDPEYISCLVRIRSQGRYNLRSQEGIILDGLHASRRTYKTLGDRAFEVAAPKLWNDVPATIKNCVSIYSFKSDLKTHLFKIFRYFFLLLGY